MSDTDPDIIFSIGDVEPFFAASLDVIIVLGGGAPKHISSPPSWVKTRCDVAAQVFQMAQNFASNEKQKKNKLPAILTLSAGTAHVPQLLSLDGLPIWESTSSAAYLMETYKNIPPSAIYAETTSYDTISNAFFARTSHTDLAGWRNILVVTNKFHMDRSKVIFDWIYSLNNNKHNPYILHYLTCPDEGMALESLQARYEHEKKQEMNLRENLIPRIKNMQDLWSFLTSEHGFYTAEKLVQRGKGNGINSSTSLKGSYQAENNNSLTTLRMRGTNSVLILYAVITTAIILSLFWRKKYEKTEVSSECMLSNIDKNS